MTNTRPDLENYRDCNTTSHQTETRSPAETLSDARVWEGALTRVHNLLDIAADATYAALVAWDITIETPIEQKVKPSIRLDEIEIALDHLRRACVDIEDDIASAQAAGDLALQKLKEMELV